MPSMFSAIGPYQVIRPLGAGGMGEVFLAHDPRLERQVAIKRIRPDAGLDDERRARLRREARVAAGLAHPAIVQVFDLLTLGEADAIVMEYIPGPTLRQVLRPGPLPFAEGLRIAIAIAEALEYAHRQGVIHRDLKTENVLLAPDGRVKIADFGIARRTCEAGDDEELTRDGILLGTRRVMSPEQVCGGPVDARSDLFSFGVLLYEVFTGRSPFLAPSPAATVQRILRDEPPPASEVDPRVPPELSDLIAGLLEKDPSLRRHDAGEVADRLQALASATAEGVEATATLAAPVAFQAAAGTPGLRPSLDRGTAGTYRPRLGWRAAGVSLLLLAGLGATAVRFLPRSRPELPRPLYVAVLEPELRGGTPSEDTGFLAFTLGAALRSALTSLEDVHLGEVGAVTGTPAEVARVLAADEVIATAFVCRAGSCAVEVGRLRGEDGRTTWSGQIEVPLAEPLTAVRALAVLLREAYAERRPRAGMAEIDASPGDFAEYLAVKRDVVERRPGATTAHLLRRLAAIRRRSPRLVDAYLLEAQIEVNRFTSVSRDPLLLDRAFALLSQAQNLAPGDPEVLYTRARHETEVGRLEEAEATLAAFERQAPGDVRVLDLRADILERRGRPEEAFAIYRTAVERQPSRSRLYEFANLARSQGEIGAAREALETLLRRWPENQGGRWLLAILELTNGDPARAAALYEPLARAGDPGSLVNLGLARMLLGDHDGAARSLEEAVRVAPHNYLYLLNLAQARWLQGRRAEAEALCRRVLELAEADPSGEEWQRLTVRAQALAHVGDHRAAVTAAQEALRLAPRNGQAAFEASLVYALVGDRTASLVNAERARELGFDAPAWFRLPWFEPLLSDPGFRELATP